jgi:hypothetical protein
MLVLALLGCTSPAPDPGGPVLDLHVHCPPDQPVCDPTSLTQALDGRVTAAGLGLAHYAIATPLGDVIPDELAALPDNNEVLQAATETTDQLLLLPSLECLRDTPGNDPGFTAACLDDADRWLALGARGFKDHAGKTFEGDGFDVGRWVGAWNRYAGFCTTSGSDTPNLDCLTDQQPVFPLEHPAYRDVIRGVVEDREAVWLTHATPWSGSDELCGTADGPRRCHDVAADVLVDFARWAEQTMSLEARRRIVLAHLGFLQDDEVRLTAVLDAGLTVDLAQTAIAEAGCGVRRLVAAYPDQVVLGTDLMLGPDCITAHYEPWLHALLGPADTRARFRGTCRGTLEPAGAALNDPDAANCGVAVPADAGRRVLYDNAAVLLGL